jgi:hypothetical protein
MKTLISFLIVLFTTQISYSQCLTPKSSEWVSDNKTYNRFAISVHLPNMVYDEGKVSFSKVEKLYISGPDNVREKSYYYFFDLDSKQLYLYDCNGLIMSYDIQKVKQKKQTVYVTIDTVAEKIKFKIVFGDWIEFTQVTYFKNKKYSESLVKKRSIYYSKN